MCKFTQFNSSYNYNIFVSLQRSRLLFKDFKQTFLHLISFFPLYSLRLISIKFIIKKLVFFLIYLKKDNI
jgi:hypothetical protein